MIKAFEQQQNAMYKLLEEDRGTHRIAAEAAEVLVQKPVEQEAPEEKKKDQAERAAQKAGKPKKLFPNSALFKEWGGENLSEDEQREAQALFEKYGYNVFLSDRLPLSRDLPDTRDPRLTSFFIHRYTVCSYYIFLHFLWCVCMAGK